MLHIRCQRCMPTCRHIRIRIYKCSSIQTAEHQKVHVRTHTYTSWRTEVASRVQLYSIARRCSKPNNKRDWFTPAVTLGEKSLEESISVQSLYPPNRWDTVRGCSSVGTIRGRTELCSKCFFLFWFFNCIWLPCCYQSPLPLSKLSYWQPHHIVI